MHSVGLASAEPALAESEAAAVIGARLDYPRELCIHQLFEAAAERTPDAVAVMFDVTTNDQRPTTSETRRQGDKETRRRTADGNGSAFSHPEGTRRSSFSVQLTYAELNTRANQLAHYLRGLGVGPEVRVGVCMARTAELVVALLGVLKAGGAYLPLDPAYPTERLAFMLEDSGATVVITATKDERRRTKDEGSDSSFVVRRSSFVDLRADWPAIAKESGANLDNTASARNLAYIIYTSGSTGRPKGVAIEHSSAVALLSWAREVFTQEQLAGVLASTSICFDLSVFELFVPLSCGGRVILIENILQLAALPSGAGVTLINTVPSALAELLRIAELPGSARTVNLAGEPLPLKLVQQLYQTSTVERVFNLYGPSEDTTYSTYALAPRERRTAPPIGRPIANTQTYLLDAQLRPVPPGEPGELYLGGEGLARNYLNRPELTAERFVPNPFLTNDQRPTTNDQADKETRRQGDKERDATIDSSSFILHPSSFRLYKTGDLVRLLPDGELEYLGRIDQQVKLRGFRIELGEIEAVLEQHPAVAQAVALVREDAPGERRLVAYLVPTNDQRPTTNDEDRGLKIEDSNVDAHEKLSSILYPLSSELRTFLKERLPDYMLPSAFVLLDTLPLNPNGKLDRKALPAPAADRTTLAGEYTPPRTQLEVDLAAIWAETLAIDPVGIHDTFFDLGGHSLKATQIVARVRQSFQVELAPRSLFEHPTVATLAAQIERARGQVGAVEVPLIPTPRGVALPLSFAQQRLWFLDQLAPGNLAYNIPIALRLAGALDSAALERSLKTIAQRHASLRTTFVSRDGQPIQVIAEQSTIALNTIDLSAFPADTRHAAAMQVAHAEAQRPFDLAHGPLLRATLLRLDAAEHILLLVMHHIISDDWSTGVLFRELGALYSAYTAGRSAALSEMPIQYADFALWQRQWLQGPIRDAQLAYWRRQLASAPTALELPTDRPRPAVQTFRGATYPFALPEDLAASLVALSRQEGATLFMTLLAAFQVLLHRYTAQADIVLGTPIAGRTRAETEDLIGFFVNTLALRADLSGNPTFRELLKQVRETALDAYTHQDVPFEAVVEAVQPERHLSHTPLFQVVFALQNAPQHDHALTGLRAEPVEVHNGAAQFDLTLFMFERAGQISGTFEYNADLFDEATVARMAGHFLTMLEGTAANSDLRISVLPLLSVDERQQLLVEWNHTGSGVRGQGSGVRRTHPIAELVASDAGLLNADSVHQLFEEQAARSPDAVAVVFDAQTRAKEGRRTKDEQESFIVHRSSFIVTYAELNARANQLARHLRGLGVGPGALVGVCMERSPELVVALLSVLKAGGAYLPLDPTYPAERIAFMLEDSSVAVVITATKDEGRKTNDEGSDSSFVVRRSSFVDLHADWPAIAQQPETNLDSGAAPEHLAYVIYTSGSTGQPKGVQIEHGALLSLVYWHQRAFGVSAADQATMIASPAFDASVWELWPYLTAGASIHIPDEMTRVMPDLLRDWLLSEAITIAFLPTPLAESALALEWPASAPLRFMLAGGDRLRSFPASALPFVLVNNYGPTENTVVATSGTVPPSGHLQDAPDIGRPIANTRVYILDRQGQPAPIGIPGELHVGGAGLARGYLNRPELTAERFIPNPFSDCRLQIADCRLTQSTIYNLQSAIGTRLYRTGDLVRYLPDGRIEFLGRIDHQVKLRGFRIELNEIEAALAQHPAVREAAVIMHEDAPPASRYPERRLVAYFVPTTDDQRPTTDDGLTDKETRRQGDKQDSQLLVSLSLGLMSPELSFVRELRNYLKQKLPDYMVPSAFVPLESWPLTPNGKLDRKALPAPEATSAGQEQAYRAPRTPIEQDIAAVWADVLRIERVGVEDDFFALGGHSLLATQIVTRLRQAFRIDLPVRSLFEQPTVAALAEHIETVRRAIQGLADAPAAVRAAQESARDAAQIVRLDSGRPLPLSFGQQRLWFLDQLEPGNPRYNMPFVLRLDGPLDAGAIERSLNEVVRRHAILRTTFAFVDGQPAQVIAPALAVPLPEVDLRDISEPEREARVLELAGAEFQHGFDLARGPLLRASLLRLGEREHALLLNFHHIVFDGWSYGVFVSELAALYAAFATGGPSPLPELPVQYADFAAWQRERLQGALVERQMTYWRSQLGGELPRLALLTDRPQQSASAQRGASQAITLPARVTTGLLRLSRAEEATPFMTLLGLFTLLLARQTGQDDIVVGAPIANRAHSDSEGLIGFFLNTLVLRTNLAGSPTFRELLRRVRETALGAYAHQDLPFEKLVEQLQPDRDLERTPLFDVLFNYVNTPPAHPVMPGLTLRLQELDEQESKFPITLYATEQGDELRLLLVYQSALFSPERISGLLEQLGYMAEQIAGAPDQPIGAYSLVIPAASAILPDPRADLPAPTYTPITAIIEELAARRPEHPAITHRGRSWSYAELVQNARGIAKALVAQGLERGDVVAVSGTRSFGLIASMLAALMSGGKLLTLDQHLPHERQQVMLRAAGATYLLWADQRQPEAESDISLTTLQIDPNSGVSAATTYDGQSGAILPQIRPEDPAYIFFTSGTTGVPKGVLGWHNGLSHFLAWQRETFEIAWQDRAAQLTGLSFDVVLRDIFTPLTAGATLCLPDDSDELGAEHVLPWLERERVTMLHTVPALAQSWLVNVPRGVTLRALRWAFFAGEPLRDTLVKSWRAAFPESGAIVNLYGPTETTLAKCFYQVPSESALGVQPVGRPLPHTQALVLSEGRWLCGVGEVGEIAIRTPFRSLGYINAPEEQRKRFIKNPFGDDDRDLVYLTGDRGRYRSDGQLEILGRVDQQIKIRGVRIEPDEVTALLARHPAVRACAVVPQQNERGEYALVAYIVGNREQGTGNREQDGIDMSTTSLSPVTCHLSPQELRDYLARQLPAVMLPAAYVPLDALPLTPNGKLDRKALPPADLSQPAAQASVAPRTPLEEILAGVWAEVLGAQQVGAEDNFFEIGGHSLLASLVASRISQAFKTAFPVRALFEAPTVTQLARYMIAVEARPGQTEKIAQVLKRIKSMSAEDRRQILNR